MRFNNLKTGQKVNETFKSDDMLKEIDCPKVPVMFSYIDGDNYVFMNNEDYSQYLLNADDLEDEKNTLAKGSAELPRCYGTTKFWPLNCQPMLN
jgi:elongation factor P